MPLLETDRSSEAVQEIIGKPPHWIIRWGMTVLFLIILSIVVALWYIRYPDVLPAQVVITTADPPFSVISRSSGRVQFWVEAGKSVAKDAPLGVIQNPAKTNDVLDLKGILPTIEDAVNALNLAEMPFLNPNPQLGPIQPYYSTFLQRLNELRFFHSSRSYEPRIAAFEQQMNQQALVRNDYTRQLNLAERELNLAQSRYNTHKQLYNVGAIPRLSLQDQELALLQARRSVENQKAQISALATQTQQYRQGILELNQQKTREEQQYVNGLRDAFRLLKGSIEEWALNYLLKAPATGDVAFFKFTNSEQFAQAGEEVMTIVPQRTQHSVLIGRAFIPAGNTGKIKAGQSVRIQMDAYPAYEFGYLMGTVQQVSPLARVGSAQETTGRYIVHIGLPQELITTTRKTLQYKPEMTGTAEIITEDLRLLERLFVQLRKLWIEQR